MRYVSTRGGVAGASFEDVLFSGLAGDGGLFVPETWPELDSGDLRDLGRLSYPDLVAAVGGMFGAGDPDKLSALAGAAYGGFDRLVPITELGDERYLLELFWGPTFAFKDYALQWLGRLLDRALETRGEHYVVLGATSGDTGSAAIAAVAGRPTLDVVILYPHGRVSDVQRRQMTTVTAANVHNVAIGGTFDDCQRIVKELLIRMDRPVSSVNSINWARVMGQIPYYLWAVNAVGADEVDVAVPTGNFGNVYSAWAAKRMGVPIRRLIVGTNVNRGVVRFFEDGSVVPSEVIPTVAPAMDIQIPSNLERLVYELLDRDGDRVADAMAGAGIPGLGHTSFEGHWFTDDQIVDVIGTVFRRWGRQIDPHTAVAVAASEAEVRDIPVIVVGTAHPAKFPEVVEAAIGRMPDTPSSIADLADRDERFTVLPANSEAVEEFIGHCCTWKIGESTVH
ncbi:MAG: threonine synthase [Gammaproteobacteria bacterium]|nr:threonine synthase [Gammaproteobacteria bacterium]